MMHWLSKLKDLNQRWLYLAMVSLLMVPFVVMFPMPPGAASEATQGLYDRVEAVPKDKVVLIDSSWDQGSRAECQSQLACMVRHLCKRRIPFVVTSLGTPFAPEFANRVIEPIAKEMGCKYGVDWVNTGFLQAAGGMGVIIDGMCRDFQKLRPTDMHGTPAAELPLLNRVHSIEDIDLVYVVTYAPSAEWISFVRSQYGTPVGFGCMSIMAPNYYTFVDSGQLCGMLIGNGGAAEYETLLDSPGLGTRLIMVGSFGNGVIILAAVVGNLGAWASRRRKEPPR